MAEVRHCPQCGAEIEADAPLGLCPKCLAGVALSEGSVEDSQPKARRSAPPSLDLVQHNFLQLESLELIGQGGMGVVYKARQPGLNRTVALKILPPEAGQDPAFTERFSRVARSLARLSHPNIVAVYDFGEKEGLFYLVMEFVDGVSLRQMMDEKWLEPRETLSLIRQICDALEYAHEEGFVHRDIKPENILVDKKGRVKVADFGLAKMLEAAAQFPLTETRQVLGTLAYMAPEQIERPQTVDHRADIYSLGVVFYEMLTGELPLGRFAPPSKKIQVDVRLDAVVLKALEKEPELRYQRAGQLKTDVESIKIGTTTKTLSPELEKPFRLWTIGILIMWVLWAGGRLWRAFETLGRPEQARGETTTELVFFYLSVLGLIATGERWFQVLYRRYQLSQKLLRWSLQKRVLLGFSAAVVVWFAALRIADRIDPMVGLAVVVLAGIVLGPLVLFAIPWWAVRREWGLSVLVVSQQIVLGAAGLILATGYLLVSQRTWAGFALQAIGGAIYVGAVVSRIKQTRSLSDTWELRALGVNLAVAFFFGFISSVTLSDDFHPQLRLFLVVCMLAVLLLSSVLNKMLVGPALLLRVRNVRDVFKPEVFWGWLLPLLLITVWGSLLPLWPSRELTKTIESAFEGAVSTIAYREGTPFAVAESRGTIRLVDLSGKQLTAIHAPGATTALAWSPDGKLLAWGFKDVELAEAASGRLLKWPGERGQCARHVPSE